MDGEPRTIGKYQIIGTIGRGSMGVVYKAKDPEIGRLVAIKVLRTRTGATAFTSEGARERFMIEARSAGNLRHPNIVTIFEVHAEGDTPYIVMDFLEGEVLEGYIHGEGRLPPAQVIKILEKVADGLDYAHSKGVIHKDIKPSNILCDSSGGVFILDFGVAVVGEAEKSDLIMGTPGYMSPEQILNHPLDARSDIFSLAIVAFECFTGSRPFQGTTFNAIVGNILSSQRLSLCALVPELPLTLEQEMEKGLAREKDQRFTTCRGMIEAFARALSIQPSVKSSLIKAAEPVPTRGTTSQSTEDILHRANSLREERDRLLESQGVHRNKVNSDWMKKATIFFGFFAITGALILLVNIFRTTSGGITPEEAAKKKKFEVVDPLSRDSNVFAVKMEDPPANVPAAELTTPQLLGLISSKRISEREILSGFEVALERKPPGLLEAAIKSLGHESYIIRKEGLRTLGILKDERATDAALSLLTDSDPSVRKQAAITLGLLGGSKPVSFLEVRYQIEMDHSVKASIREAIEKITGVSPN